MFKKIIFASIFLFSSHSVVALELDSVTSAAETASEAKETVDNLNAAKEAVGTVADLKDKSVTDTAKDVVTEGAKGGVKGAVQGVQSGSITESGTKGAMEGAKSGLGL